MYIPTVFQKVWQTPSREAFLCLRNIQMVHLLHTDLETGHSITVKGAVYPIPSAWIVLGSFLCSRSLDHSDRTGGFHGQQNIRGSKIVQWLLIVWAIAVFEDLSFCVSFQNENSRTMYTWTGQGLLSKRLFFLIYFSTLEKFSQLLLCQWKKTTHLETCH